MMWTYPKLLRCEYDIFPEPRRLNPSEVDGDITAKMGDHSVAIKFMTAEGVGVQPSSNNVLLASHRQTSASSSTGGNNIGSGSMSTNLLSSSHRSLSGPVGSQTLQQTIQKIHRSQQPQHQQPYIRQPDIKPRYNGRRSYSKQFLKNDLRCNTEMASPLLPPLSGVIGESNANNSSSNSTSLLPPPSNGYLGPPKSTAPPRNEKFSNQLPESIYHIITKVNEAYRAPEQITKLAATPRSSTGNYNLNGPNRHKYSVEPVQPILGSSPSEAELLQSAYALSITPISPLPATPNPYHPYQIISNACGITSSDMPSIMSNDIATTNVSTPVLSSPLVPTAVRQGLIMSKEPLKPHLQQSGSALEKQKSTLEDDLELSESDDDSGKVIPNISGSSPGDDNAIKHTGATSAKRKRSSSHFSDDASADSGLESNGSSVKNYNAGTTRANSIPQGNNNGGGNTTTRTGLPNVPSLICKIDLSRLQRILPEWRTNTYRISNNSMRSTQSDIKC